MKTSTKTAELQLIELINKLSNESKVLKNNEFISVLGATKSICANKPFIENLLQALKIINQSKNTKKDYLTKREIQVLQLIGEGLKNTNIAEALNLSKSTVETHRKNIRKKLQLNNHDNLYIIAMLFNLQHQNTQDH